MANNDVALMGHLMRRAGFGAQYHELEARAAKGYEETVEELLHPSEDTHGMDLDLAERYFIEWNHHIRCVPEYIAFRMVNSKSQLEEKMILFWHGILCHTDSKNQSQIASHAEWEMLRRCGLDSFKDLLIEISKDPAMVYFLDNCLSHKDAINENYGRELLELFSLGVGMDGEFNYTEDDVKECARAFTGWTLANGIPPQPYGRYTSTFVYNPEDHDDGEKTFLGHTGNFNGEDIIDIILEEPATAQFIARHLYSFFVSDEVQVPAWSVTPPADPEAVDTLAKVMIESDYDMRLTMNVLLNSDFFKAAQFTKIKNPTEVVVGTLRLVGDAELPSPNSFEWSNQIMYMGQDLLNPPSVEGWHYGPEWVNSGLLMTRTNFVADMLSETDRPGVRTIIDRVGGAASSPEQLVDSCLDLLGPFEVSAITKDELVAHASTLTWSDGDKSGDEENVAGMLQLIVSTREYMFA